MEVWMSGKYYARTYGFVNKINRRKKETNCIVLLLSFHNIKEVIPLHTASNSHTLGINSTLKILILTNIPIILEVLNYFKDFNL